MKVQLTGASFQQSPITLLVPTDTKNLQDVAFPWMKFTKSCMGIFQIINVYFLKLCIGFLVVGSSFKMWSIIPMLTIFQGASDTVGWDVVKVFIRFGPGNGDRSFTCIINFWIYYFRDTLISWFLWFCNKNKKMNIIR